MESNKTKKRCSSYKIESFFKCVPKKDKQQDEVEHDEKSGLISKASDGSSKPTTSTSSTTMIENNKKDAETLQTSEIADSAIILGHIVKDVGLYINKSPDDFTKSLLLEEHWEPPPGYVYPYSINSKGVKRYLSKTHLEKHSWLVLSDARQGLFCKFCALFAQEKAGNNKGVKLGKLVVEPLTNFKDLMGKNGDLQSHEGNTYHKNCVLTGKAFLETYKCPEKEVVNQVNTERLRQVTENRLRLLPIIKTIILLGRQNIPLRGHRDDGPLSLEESVSNQGNFKALLKFRVDAGDTTLEKHLQMSSSRATYISKTTQNALIECCGEEIKGEILRRVQEAKYWSLLFDETTDRSNKEQMTLIVRYLHNETVREDFLTFVDAYQSASNLNDDSAEADDEEDELPTEIKLTGKSLGQIVLSQVKELGLDLHSCVGIGTDGASVMTSQESGSVTEILKEATNAKRLPCYNHALNNSISKSAKVQTIRNAVGVIKEAVHFFNNSAKRNRIVKSHLGGQLVSLCETRWIERHDAVILFYCALPEVVDAFAEIREWKESESAKKAALYLNSLTSTEFIFACACLTDILKRTLPLSRLLQTPSLDLNKASNAVQDTLSSLTESRSNCNNSFADIYLDAKTTAEKLNVELRMPRTTIRQKNRENHEANSVEEYFRRCMYIPLLENVIVDLQSRFAQNTLMCFDLNLFLPTSVLKLSEATESELADIDQRVKKVSKNFENILPVPIVDTLIGGEMSIWREKWMRENGKGRKIPTTVIDIIKECDQDLYPIINHLLKILITLPVSVASAERSFSSLNLVKSWLRTRMGEDRLNGLCLLFIHKDIIVDAEKVIERYAKGGSRRIKLELVL